jgi:hypothetical protein
MKRMAHLPVGIRAIQELICSKISISHLKFSRVCW